MKIHCRNCLREFTQIYPNELYCSDKCEDQDNEDTCDEDVQSLMDRDRE